jgi:hypothetical protein
VLAGPLAGLAGLQCIGALLQKCPELCKGCWYANANHKPTLVQVAVFNKIEDQRRR